MKKFSLRRFGAFATAVALTVTLSACSNRNNNDSSSVLPEDDKIIADVVPNKPDVNDNVQDKTEMEEALNKPFVYDSTLPIVVPIEKVELEDGKIGYKMPRWYTPFLVDESKPMPGMTGVYEVTDEYTIELAEGYRTNPDGTRTEVNFDGCVAVYAPYYLAWYLKTEKPEEYEAKKQAIFDDLGPAAIAYQILESADTIPELASDVYYNSLDTSYGRALN